MVYDEPVPPKSGGGGARPFFTDPKRPKMNVTLPASSSFDHGREVIGAGRVGVMGLGTEGSVLRVCFARRRFVDVGVGGVGAVVRGIVVDSDAMTSSAKSSNPGRELMTRVVVTGCGLCLRGGMGKDRIVRDEHGGKENVPDVHDASGGASAGVAGVTCVACDSAATAGFARVEESSVDFPEEDVVAGIADDDEPPDDDDDDEEEDALDDELCRALVRAQANLGGAGV